MNEEKTPTRAKESGNNKEKLKQSKEGGSKGDKQRQRTATQELKARQRAEIYALNKVMTELEQRQFEEFRRQMLLGEAGGGNQTPDTEVMPACRI
uniref:small vasohibin-binding protein n=1 Tax=Myxine glutinosa TaxID=7769 RepID=UPI00358FD414